jgi:hypothetical protein
MSVHHRDNNGSGQGFADRQKQRLEQRQAMLATIARRKVEASATDAKPLRTLRSAAEVLKGIDGLRLYRVGGATRSRALSSHYRALVEKAIDVINTGDRFALLCWPPAPVCMPAIVALLALGDVACALQKQVAPEPGRIDTVADAALGVRVALFPSGRRTHGPAREFQIDRHDMATLQMRHVLREHYGNNDAAFKDYHTVLSRVGAMTGKGRDGRSYTEYEHPILDELVPHGSPKNGCAEDGTLLWRTKSKTDLGKFTRTGAADRSDQAHFFLFEIAADHIEQEMPALSGSIDLLLLDLSKSGRGKLGREWISKARKGVDAFSARHPTAGILAITDDPWSYDALRFEVLGRRASTGSRKMIPAASRALYSPDATILQEPQQGTTIFAGGLQIITDGFSGQSEISISKLRETATKLQNRGNPSAAQIAHNIITKLRRCVSLPGSLSQLSEFLEREADAAVAAENMAAFRVAVDLAAFDDPRAGATQIASAERTAVRAEASEIVAASQSATPMSFLLDETLAPAMRSSSRTILILRNEMIADFVRDRLSRTLDKFEDRLDRDIIRVTTRQGLVDLAEFTQNFRNQFKRAIVVAPTRQSVLEILSEPWLPDGITFLADSDTLRFAARDASRLALQLDHTELRGRFNRFAAAASVRIKQIGAHVVELDSNIQATEDVEYLDGAVIDLTGPRRGDKQLVELQLQSGQRILARPRTGLVQRDDSHSVRRFVEISASEVKVGDDICAIGPRFIEKARTLLNITAAAAEEIRDYHALVTKRFMELQGTSRSSRLKLLCEKMGNPAVSIATAVYWVDLEDQADKALHEVVPHAPRDRDQFMRFTSALEISPQLAARFWAWAVIAQRSSRMRAGVAFHDAYKGILTDQYAALAANKTRATEIRALRAAADDYASPVSAIRKVGRA